MLSPLFDICVSTSSRAPELLNGSVFSGVSFSSDIFEVSAGFPSVSPEFAGAPIEERSSLKLLSEPSITPKNSNFTTRS